MTITSRHRRILAVTTALSLAGAALAVSAPAAEAARPTSTAVLDWNEVAGRAALAACQAPFDNPLHESRSYTMASLAVHDALNAIDRRSESYGATFHAPGRASVDAAIAAAEHDALVAGFKAATGPFADCAPAGIAIIEDFYAKTVAAIPDGATKDAGLRTGQRAAAAIIQMRAHDNSDLTLFDFGYDHGTAPGQYQLTPGYTFAYAEHWAKVTPFSLRRAAQFRSSPPLALTSTHYARDLNEVKDYGGDGVTTPTKRTARQTEAAHFWWESSPLMWNAIGRTLATTKRLDPWQQARMFSLLNMALADGYISVLDEKYHYAYWRPVTAIRAADTDGNPATTADPTWTPLEVTPGIPDYPSGHAIEGGAAAGVFMAYFGTDHIPFSACSVTVTTGDGTCGSANPILHHFSSFTDAAAENAVSRVWIGFHFRYATQQGTSEGLKLGKWTVQHHLRPTH
ncbi:MAG: vanadium-dependent haloperoxidase [Lapillicoccus sp.]